MFKTRKANAVKQSKELEAKKEELQKLTKTNDAVKSDRKSGQGTSRNSIESDKPNVPVPKKSRKSVQIDKNNIKELTYELEEEIEKKTVSVEQMRKDVSKDDEIKKQLHDELVKQSS